MKSSYFYILSFLSKIFTTQLSASTSTRSPSFSTCVAIFVHITHGFPSSRAIIAAWQVIPQVSVTIAIAFFIAGTKSGAVYAVTRI